MPSFLSWYLLTTLLGWLTFPLAYRLFAALPERGYTLSRTFGLMLWGFIFWLLASLGIAQNDAGGLLLALSVLIGLSAWAIVNRKSEIENWISGNRHLILASELLFLIAFGFMAFFRAANPEILGTEKPMELMFINGIMNSPSFPPRDLWLSGYSISYYYFGYVMTAMLATFTAIPATAAFNLMLALIFGLAALGAYGILYNLLEHYHSSITDYQLTLRRTSRTFPERTHANAKTFGTSHQSSIVNSLLAPLFLLLISNLEGFLEVLHARGWFWRDGVNFWTWLDIPELRNPPPAIPSWTPDRFWWWWRASRVVQDYDLNGNFREAIDEFPAFSFLLGDLHPHVLSIPFFLLAVAFALNLFLGGSRGRMNLYIGEVHISKTGFLLAAFLLGGMAFLNTWDILPVAALIVFSYALARVHESGWGWERIEDVLLLGIPLLGAAYLLYLPFFIGFDSQAGGIVPNFMYVTRGAHLWVMWGTLFVPLFFWLIHQARSATPAWGKGIAASLGIVALLLTAMLMMGFLAYRLRPELAQAILQGQGRDAAAFLADSFTRRLNHIGSLLTLLGLLIPTLAFLFSNNRSASNERTFILHPSSFILLLITLGVLLILGPDFLYLQDNFGYRINTVFKFYYQAWILLSLAAACAAALLLRQLRGVSNLLFNAAFLLILLAGLTYPVLAFPNKANNFQPPFGFTLNDFDRLQRENPEEAAAILWLKAAPDGVILEATGNPYSSYGRISIYSGLPTLLGWGNHEGQWRGSDFQGILAQRQSDIETLYTTPNWETTQALLRQYNVRYVIVGSLERASYRVNEAKFNNFLKPVFQQGNVTIYEVPQP
jgi:YYY domain-containing protein